MIHEASDHPERIDESNHQHSHLSVILLLALSFLLFSLSLKQYLHHHIDEMDQISLQSTMESFDFKVCLNDQAKMDSTRIKVHCVTYDPLNLNFLNPPKQLQSKLLFDFYYSPKPQKETSTHKYGKKIKDQTMVIFSLEKQAMPNISMFQLVFVYLVIFGLILFSFYQKLIKDQRLIIYALIAPILISLQILILLQIHIGDVAIYHPSLILVPLVATLPLLLLSYFEWKNQNQISKDRLPYRYLAPALIAVFLLVFMPFLYGVALSFTQKINGQTQWVGLSHFYRILIQGLIEIKITWGFYATLLVTIIWTLANLALHLSMGMGLALILNQKNLKFKGFYRVLLILPWAVPSYITALIWKGMFHQQYGLINAILRTLNLSEVAWMGGFWQAFASNLICNTWLGFPFMMVVTLGALQSIPSDLYEASTLDGASGWQQFKKITLPLLMPALMPSILLSSVWTFNMFNVIYLVSAGKPAGQTDILITQAYRIAFEQDQHGYAAAYSMVIFLILLIFALLSQKWTKKTEMLY